MKMSTLLLAMLVSFNVLGQEIRGSWRDQPLFSYKPTEADKQYERKLIEQNLLRARTIKPEVLAEMMKAHPTEQKDRIFISLNNVDNNLIGLAAATSLGLIVFKQDDELMDLVQGNKTEFTAEVAELGNHFGYITGIGPIVIGSYFLGVVMKNGKLKDIGLIAVGAGLATQLVTEGFKEVFGRRRPNVDLGAYEFFVDEGKSFFSGHTSAAFSLATIISEVYGKDYPVVPYIAYGAAALTAYARMHDKKHWGSDVLVGAIAGHLITKIIYKIYIREEVPEEERWMSIAPWYEGRSGAIGFQVDYVPKKWR